jgi:hypothetical protein
MPPRISINNSHKSPRASTTSSRVLLLALIVLLALPSVARRAAPPSQPGACPAAAALLLRDNNNMEVIPADRLAELAATAQALVAPGKGILVRRIRGEARARTPARSAKKERTRAPPA